MGLYICSTAFGGMSGRVLAGLATDIGCWRAAIGTIRILGLIAAVVFITLLPPSRHFTLDAVCRWPIMPRRWYGSCATVRCPKVFLCGFVLMGALARVYNYIGYRLSAPPYELGQAAIGSIFLVYLSGIVASTVAGRTADRHGRGPVLVIAIVLMSLGLACTLAAAMSLIVAGIALITIGFFAGHSVASGWVGPLAASDKGHAAGLYLLAYYPGSSLIGALGAIFWSGYGWPGVAGMVAILLTVGMIATARLTRWQARGEPPGE